MKKKNTIVKKSFDKKITRKQAINKAGITALTAASLVFLETKDAAAQSGPAPAPNW